MTSSPVSQRNRSATTPRPVPNSVPCCLRHIEQWQCANQRYGGAISKATAPQRQEPDTDDSMVMLSAADEGCDSPRPTKPVKEPSAAVQQARPSVVVRRAAPAVITE